MANKSKAKNSPVGKMCFMVKQMKIKTYSVWTAFADTRGSARDENRKNEEQEATGSHCWDDQNFATFAVGFTANLNTQLRYCILPKF